MRFRPVRPAPRLTSPHRRGGGARAARAALLVALALAGCQGQAPPPVVPPPDPPSGPLRPGEPIPYASLAEHLGFNTKSRMQLMRLNGRVIQVRGVQSLRFRAQAPWFRWRHQDA